MKWKTLEEELPDYEREIFAKIQEQAYNNNNPEYIECYVLTREKNWCGHNGDSYIEALGERYMSFAPSEIIGWVYVDDLQEMLDNGE